MLYNAILVQTSKLYTGEIGANEMRLLITNGKFKKGDMFNTHINILYHNFQASSTSVYNSSSFGYFDKDYINPVPFCQLFCVVISSFRFTFSILKSISWSF